MFHKPIENRGYRIRPKGEGAANLKKNWPTQKHKLLSTMISRYFIPCDETSITQNELTFITNKGSRSQIIKDCILKGHIKRIKDTYPYRYSLTSGGEQYALNIFCNFSHYKLDLLNTYIDWSYYSVYLSQFYKETDSWIKKAYDEHLLDFSRYNNIQDEMFLIAMKIDEIKKVLSEHYTHYNVVERRIYLISKSYHLETIHSLCERMFQFKYISQLKYEKYMSNADNNYLDYIIKESEFASQFSYYNIIKHYEIQLSILESKLFLLRNDQTNLLEFYQNWNKWRDESKNNYDFYLKYTEYEKNKTRKRKDEIDRMLIPFFVNHIIPGYSDFYI